MIITNLADYDQTGSQLPACWHITSSTDNPDGLTLGEVLIYEDGFS